MILEKFDEILGLGVKDMKEEEIILPDDIKALLKARERLRKEKKWAESDILRERIKEKGYLIKDTPQGPKVEKA